ncbi:transposase [Thiorhodococcus mannitoliphagus]|uniref:transposase n=1 Tax=Thiorhodococcus mannitoliphagus TaxID=329406 RepID=UPI001F10BD66|nr:transposase [Thiorhodococcus mannitoliphagus]
MIANFEVATGQVVTPSIGETRTEADFLAHIATTVDTDPDASWIFVCDQLNIHQSASLIEFVAQRCAIDTDLGRKDKEGILKRMASRAAFLQDPTHRIRFVYTPKHCSWLNQVEIWFGILTRRLLKRGRFASTEELKQRILDSTLAIFPGCKSLFYQNLTMRKKLNEGSSFGVLASRPPLIFSPHDTSSS